MENYNSSTAGVAPQVADRTRPERVPYTRTRAGKTKMAVAVELPWPYVETWLLRYREPRPLVDAYVRAAHAGVIPACLYLSPGAKRHQIAIDEKNPRTLEFKISFMHRRHEREARTAAMTIASILAALEGAYKCVVEAGSRVQRADATLSEVHAALQRLLPSNEVALVSGRETLSMAKDLHAAAAELEAEFFALVRDNRKPAGGDV